MNFMWFTVGVAATIVSFQLFVFVNDARLKARWAKEDAEAWKKRVEQAIDDLRTDVSGESVFSMNLHKRLWTDSAPLGMRVAMLQKQVDLLRENNEVPK